MNIGIIGFGVVGRAVWNYHREKHIIWTYDTATDSQTDFEALDKNAEVVFVCVPTPFDMSTGELCMEAVKQSVDRLTGPKKVVLKSTLMPGTTDELQDKHRDMDIVYVPEFLDEDTAERDYAQPRVRQVVGVPASKFTPDHNTFFLLPWVADLLPGGQAKVCVAKQAELLKLATNCFYALKVVFANQFFDVGMTQDTLNILGMDNRVGPHHLEIEHKSYRGFGGKCLPKDAMAMACKYNLALMQVACGINVGLLLDRGLCMEDFYGMPARKKRIIEAKA